jgi:hypothetical protein
MPPSPAPLPQETLATLAREIASGATFVGYAGGPLALQLAELIRSRHPSTRLTEHPILDMQGSPFLVVWDSLEPAR